MNLSMFREAGINGNPGPVSMRRVLAFLLVVAAVGLFVVAFFFAKEEDWFAYIPGVACLVGALLLLFFTTWTDVVEVAKAIKE